MPHHIYKKRFSDRPDGRRLRSLDPFYSLMPFIMRERNDASNLFQDSIEISAMENFLLSLRNDGHKGIGILHAFIAAYVRCVAKFPALNRFISGSRIFARHNIEIIMTIKKNLSIDAGESAFKLRLSPDDDIIQIYNKMSAEINKIKAGSLDNSTDNLAALLAKFPRFFLRLSIRFLGWLDYHGILPTSILDASPFHGSLVISDLGSIAIGSIFHHLYNFGNVPIFLSFGAKRKSFSSTSNSFLKFVDFTIVCDERICDGYYYAQAVRHLKHFFRNPSILLDKPDVINSDVP